MADTLHCSIILLQETEIMQQSFLEIIRDILYVTDMTAATSLNEKDTRCGCRAHTRRNSLRSFQQIKELVSTSMAAKGMNMINVFYTIECSFEELDSKEKPKQRQERLKLALDAVSHGLKQIMHHRERS